MKHAEAIKLLEAGTIGFFAEYRNSKAETITYADKLTGRTKSMQTLRHTIEVASDLVTFEERVGEDFKPDVYKAPFTKGQKVFAYLTRLANDKGVIRAGGRLEIVTA